MTVSSLGVSLDFVCNKFINGQEIPWKPWSCPLLHTLKFLKKFGTGARLKVFMGLKVIFDGIFDGWEDYIYEGNAGIEIANLCIKASWLLSIYVLNRVELWNRGNV